MPMLASGDASMGVLGVRFLCLSLSLSLPLSLPPSLLPYFDRPAHSWMCWSVCVVCLADLFHTVPDALAEVPKAGGSYYPGYPLSLPLPPGARL